MPARGCALHGSSCAPSTGEFLDPVRIAEVPQGRASDIISNPRDDLVSTLTVHDGAVLVMSSRTAKHFRQRWPLT